MNVRVKKILLLLLAAALLFTSGRVQQQKNFFDAHVHCVPWAVASSRRLKK